LSSNTNIGNTPVNQGYVQLIHTGETGGIDGTLRTLYDGDGTASDLQIASNKVKVSTELYIGSKTITEYVQDVVGDMFDTNGSHTNITATYDDDGDGAIDLVSTGEVTLTGTQTLTNKTLASPTFTGTASGVNLTLSGDLTVNGTTTTVNQTNLDVSDNIIGLNRGASENFNDSGLIIERGSTGDNAAIIWDESADKFTLGTTTSTPSATGNLTISTGTLVANLEGSASLNLLISNNLSDLNNASTARTNLGVAIGSDVQAYDAGLQSISGLTTSANKMIYTTASDTYATTTLSAVGRSLIDDNTVVDMRTTLGLGTIATQASDSVSITGGSITGITDLSIADGGTGASNAHNARINLGLGTLAELNSIQVANFLASAITTSAEAFADTDTTVMTSAAINDRIESFGYGVGDMTGVSITASNPLDISQSNTTSGDYSATISLDATEFQGYLTDMTDLIAGFDELLVIDSSDTTLKRKAINEIRLTTFDDTGFSSGISFNGSTANGLLTYGNSTTADVETDLVYTATGLGIGTASPSYKLDVHGVGRIYSPSGDADLRMESGYATNTTSFMIRNGAGNNRVDFLTAGANAMTINSSQNVGIGTTSPEGKVHIYNGDASVAPDSDGDELVVENSGDSGISILSGESSIHTGSLIFGSANDAFGAGLQYSYYGNKLRLMTANTGHKLEFATDNNNTAMTIDSSQNVGIGTTSPSVDLHILDTSGHSQLKIETDSASHGAYLGLQNTDNEYLLYNFGGNFIIDEQGVGERFRIQDGTGNVGIGTSSPDAKLEVTGSTNSDLFSLEGAGTSMKLIAESGDASSANVMTYRIGMEYLGTYTNGFIDFYRGGGGTDGYLTFGTSGTEKMRIDGSGNVLIGGTSASGHGFNLEVLNDHAYVKGPDGWDGNGDKAIVALGSGVSNESFGCGYVYGTGLVLSTYKLSGGGDFGSSTQNSLVITDTVGQAKFINDVVAFATSDKRLKENVKPLDSALDKVLQINGVEFDWIDGKDEHGNNVHGNEGHDVGVIAQEIEKVLPEVVHTRDNGYKAVKYEKIVPLLIQAIKEQQQQIEELKNG
jgi:hypothetical protein